MSQVVKKAMVAAATTMGVYAADSCTVLALSGGGANGAWEMGVLWGLLHYGNPDDYKYDVVTGISAGSINAIATIGWAIGDEVAATEWGSDLWKNLHTSDVYKNWPLSIVEGLLTKGGIFDNTPLRDYLLNMLKGFDGEFKRRITVGSIDANTGDYFQFTQDNTDFLDFAKAATASASIPAVFPPYIWEGKGVFLDGSTNKNLELTSIVDQCKQIVDDESKITVDVFICSNAKDVVEEEDSGKTIWNYLRAQKIHNLVESGNTLDYMMRAHPKINFRHVVYQQHPMTIGAIDFNGDHTWKAQLAGRDDAKTALGLAGQYQKNWLDWDSNDALKKEFPDYQNYWNALIQ